MSLLVILCIGCSSSPTPTDRGEIDEGPAPREMGPVDAPSVDAPRDAPATDLPPVDQPMPPAPCVPTAYLLKLASPISCTGMQKVKVPVSQMPDDCHTQGIGWHTATSGFVVSCMDESGGGARVLAFPSAANDAGQWLTTGTKSLFVSNEIHHPSAIQIGANIFPIAMAKTSSAGPSEIQFFAMAPGPSITGPIGMLSHAASHIGALAYANLGGKTHMVGCGWDCATMAFWSASGGDRHGGFTLVKQATTADLVTAGGVDSNVGLYNSIHLVLRCEDNQPLLFASHEDWLDVWEITDLGTSSVMMKKVVKRQITEPAVLWGDKKLFYEGMSLEIAGGQIWVWAAPHDFGTKECPAGTRCMQYVYRCTFGS